MMIYIHRDGKRFHVAGSKCITPDYQLPPDYAVFIMHNMMLGIVLLSALYTIHR